MPSRRAAIEGKARGVNSDNRYGLTNRQGLQHGARWRGGFPYIDIVAKNGGLEAWLEVLRYDVFPVIPGWTNAVFGRGWGLRG